MRPYKEYIFLLLKGMAMGAADVVPGVSGGTIAFITGIYEELLETISSINIKALKILFRGDFKAFWNHINGNFVLTIFLGIGISIVTLARVITYLLDNHPIVIWSFFFGLILSSVYLVGKKVKKWNLGKILGLIIGSALAYYITILPPMENPNGLWFIFLSGAIAICAMILPGISGSFILLLLGSFEVILNAIKDVKLITILTFALGCLAGLLSFSGLLNWMFKRYHDLTIAVLTGFLIGSLNKIWPWKKVITTRTNSHGEVVPFIQKNVLPNSFESDPKLFLAITVAFVGLGIILTIEKIAKENNS